MNKLILDKNKKGVDLIQNEDIDILIINVSEPLSIKMLDKYNSKVNNEGIIIYVLNNENLESYKEILSIGKNKYNNEIYIDDKNKVIITYNMKNEELQKNEEIFNLLNLINVIGMNDFKEQILNILQYKEYLELGKFTILTDNERYYKSSSSCLRFLGYKFNLVELF